MLMTQTSNLFFFCTDFPPYVLNNTSLEIPDGNYVSVVGENGYDESTLMWLILKFIKPTDGIIESKAKRIRYIPQKNSFSNMNLPITVSEIPHSYRKLLETRDKSVIVSGIVQVGMNDSENAPVGALSDGQGQRILIARALLRSPDLLILDEPSAGVDTESQKEIYGFLKKLNREKGIMIIPVERNLNAAITNPTFLYHLTAGRGHLYTPEQYTKEYLHGEKKGESNTQL